MNTESRIAFAAEITTASDGWTGNQIVFATHAEAQAYVLDLMGRWLSVTNTRVVKTAKAVNYRWVDGRLHAVDGHDSETGAKS
jgi:hypothetical protein